MERPPVHRLLRPIAQIQEKEVFTAVLMFAYSFLAMTAHNIVKPISRSQFITDLGADNMPYVQLAVGVLAGVVMAAYAWLMSRLPRRWCLPIAQGGVVALLVGFWLLFRSGSSWASVPFYFLVQLLGVLLISQFWTLANVVYEPRQAKRLFGFIGAGASLGGFMGSYVDTWARQIATVNLMLFSAGAMTLCLLVVILIIRRENVSELNPAQSVAREKGVRAGKAIDLLLKSKHLRIIALVISCAAIGAGIIEQQFNMAVAEIKGRANTDTMTAYLGQIQLYVSACGFFLQALLTSRIHRYLGIGFALLLLPMTMGTTATIILLNGLLWAPATARFLDQSLRYTVDKTTREILYMPLSADIKFEAKPFVDVTVDRFAKALGAILMLVAIKPWGLGLTWQHLSFATGGLTVVWLLLAWRARSGYRTAFRQSIATREIKPAEVRIGVADLSAIETLIQELASPDARKVLYAIDLLESLDKRNLITPLLLFHESPSVKVRALELLCSAPAADTARWLPVIRNMMADENPEVRAAAVGALANIQDEQINVLVRPYLEDGNPRIAMTAAMVLSGSPREEDLAAAEKLLEELVADTRATAVAARREFAIALRHMPKPRFRRLLIPLLSDNNPEVAGEAMQTVRHLGAPDFIFVPTLISLLGNFRLKNSARELLVGRGEEVLSILGHFLKDPDEDLQVRAHIPDTMARIPCQKAMDILSRALAEPNGFLRFRILAALEKLHRHDPQLTFSREAIESLALKEGDRCLDYRKCHRALFEREKSAAESLLARALLEKSGRALDRVYRCLGVIYPWKDIASARWAVERTDSRSRSSALEYLDNLLTGTLRKRLMPVLEGQVSGDEAESPKEGDGKIVLHLIRDADPVLSAAAVLYAWQIRLDNLDGELEHILAERDARDWYTFEAASWVSAALRLQEAGRKRLWMEPMPSVELADRMRSLPLFASLSIDGLFRITSAASQIRHEPERVLYQQGSAPEILHLLLDGRVSCRSTSGSSREVKAPAVLAFPEVIEKVPMPETARADGTAVCLDLTGDECRALLADDTELVQSLFRILCCPDKTGPANWIHKGERREVRALPAVGALNPIEKMLVLKEIPAFSEVSAEEIPGLASITSEIPLEPGATLFEEADAPALYALLSGEISLDFPQDQPSLAAGPNDTLGIEHTLAGVSPGCNARVTKAGLALRVDRDDLFDLMAQRPDLLSQLFGAVSRSRAAKTAMASA